MTTFRATDASRLFAAARTMIAAAAFSLVGANAASAYVGDSFMQIPGVDGGWKGENYKDWVKVEADYWPSRARIGLGSFRRGPSVFSGPAAPRKGASTLNIALDKTNPIVPVLMDKCVHKTAIPEMTYAESSDQARGPRELGPRPADVPAYFEYKLKNVRFSACPVVADAPQQAFILSYNDIEWLNYHNEADYEKLTLEPAPLAPLASSGKTKSFVLTWFAVAHDVSDDQCPVMNAKPTEADYYALMSKKDAGKERADLAGKGGVNYENGQMGFRGPDKLNVCNMPGIVKDPGQAEPQTALARGLNLDGDDGAGAPPAGTCKHKNYTSADGQTGIDNQLYTVEGCVAGFQGHKGFLMQFANNSMRDGLFAMLVEISGIDNEQNDDSVDVTLLYSVDPMGKNAAGTQALSDYTFRVTDKPEYTHYFNRVHGRIVNGVVITDPVKDLKLNLGPFGTPWELKLADARMRIALMPDGTIKGVLGGYRDWRELPNTYVSSTVELYHGFQTPALYNSLRRAADGMKNPVTGECDGISTAYDMEGIPAYILPAQNKTAQAEEHAEKAP
jgi:hypothetical protein